MAEKKQNISVTIEDVVLPLTVSSAEEEKLYRDAASLIQNRVQRLREVYKNLPSDKYYYVMAMLNTSIDAVRTSNRSDNTPLLDMMSGIGKELDALNIK